MGTSGVAVEMKPLEPLAEAANVEVEHVEFVELATKDGVIGAHQQATASELAEADGDQQPTAELAAAAAAGRLPMTKIRKSAGVSTCCCGVCWCYMCKLFM